MKTENMFIIKLAIITNYTHTDFLKSKMFYNIIDRWFIAQRKSNGVYKTLDGHKFTIDRYFKNVGEWFIIETYPVTMFYPCNRHLSKKFLKEQQEEFDNDWFKRTNSKNNKSEK